MINWPHKKADGYIEIKGLMPNLEKPQIGVSWTQDKIDGYNEAIDECMKAEKSGRMSVVELSQHTLDLVDEFFPKGECAERGKAIVLHAKMLIAIYNTLYGDTKPDERKEV